MTAMPSSKPAQVFAPYFGTWKRTERGTPAPETFVKIGEGTMAYQQSSASFPVSGYREIVVYWLKETDCSSLFDPWVSFRANAQAPFGRTFQSAKGRIQVNGTDVQLHIDSTATCKVDFVIAGVK